MVDADIVRAIAEGRVPTNITYITPEYLNENRDPPAIIAIIVITAIVSVILALRFFSRIFLVKSFGLDDGLALFSYGCFIAFVALCLVLIGQGSGRHIEYIQYILTQSETNSTEVNDYVAHLIYTSALFVCRVSGLAFFYRLCSRHEPLLRAVWVAGALLVCAFLPQFFLILAHCTPITGLWPYAWQPGAENYKCVTWGTVYVTNSGLSLVCDFVIFSIPVAMLSLLKLSRSRKIMLAFVLMPGVVVIGISVTRLYLCVVGQWATDGSWYYNPQLAIEVAEIGGTLIALSIPGLKPLFALWYESMRTSVGSTFRRTEEVDLERTGPTGGTTKVELSRRKSSWMKDVRELNRVQTSVNAENSITRGSTRGSSRASDDELLHSKDIVVQMEFEQSSSPLGVSHPRLSPPRT